MDTQRAGEEIGGGLPLSEKTVPDKAGQMRARGTLAERIEIGAERLAHVLENITKLIAYVTVMTTWLVIGFVAWIATLFCGILVLIAVMVFRLVAGLPVERETTRFLTIMQFWPDGFTSLTTAFWSKAHQQEIETEEDRTQSSYLFAILRIIYVVIVIYLLICIYNNANPLTYLLLLPGNPVIAIFLISLLTLGMSFLADTRRAGGFQFPSLSAPTTVPSTSGVEQAAPEQGHLQRGGAANSSTWTGR